MLTFYIINQPSITNIITKMLGSPTKAHFPKTNKGKKKLKFQSFGEGKAFQF